MNTLKSFVAQHASALVALICILASYQLSQLPEISEQERSELASRFHFTRIAIPELPGHSYKSVRAVHPTMRSISAWISSLGAAAALADLDGDGLANDLCHVDPRTDLVTVAPVPTTPARYPQFVLDPSPLPYDASTMAPMGCLAGDFNEDGLMDVLVYYWGRTPILFLRKAPSELSSSHPLSRSDYVTRELVPEGGRWYTNAATLADFDGDGHLDLLVANYFPDGQQILDARGSGVAQMHESMGSAHSGGRKHFFLWAGAVSGKEPAVVYREVGGVLPENIDRGWTLAAGAADLDGDLLPEVYLANDFGPDSLLHNCSTPGKLCFTLLQGQGGFTTPKSFVLGHDSFKGMGVDFADLNGDGFPDIYVSNIAQEWGLEESHFLWMSTGHVEQMNAGVAPYAQASESLGLSRSGWGWDCRLDDFDNDGVLEAVQATGFIKGSINRWPELQALGTANSLILHDPRLWPRFGPGDDLSGNDHLAFFVRSQSGRYYDLAHEIGLDEPMVSRAISIADVDGDGRLDIVVANQWETSYFLHNESSSGNSFLGLHLLLPLQPNKPTYLRSRAGHPGADTPGRPAVGAVATVYLPDGRRLVAQVDGGSGHSGKRSPDLHFGLGKLPPDSRIPVELHWRDPGGAIHRDRLTVSPGWHTVQLGWPREGDESEEQ
jgi:enediyne biosynthesis protein E4